MIVLAYLGILFRIIPICLHWISRTQTKNGSFYFFLFSLISFGSDLLGIIFNYYKIQTDLVFSFYQIAEIIVSTSMAIELGNFKKKFRIILFIFCSLQIVSSGAFYTTYHLDDPQEINLGISKLYVLSILFVSAIHYIRNSEANRKINIAPLIGLLGIFIYESLSIIPIISLNLQRTSLDHQKTFTLYFFLLFTGNFLRDLLISHAGILNIKKQKK
ncbi:MAG: hypothetical protein RL062_378 [Bacteroidota bacterium]